MTSPVLDPQEGKEKQKKQKQKKPSVEKLEMLGRGCRCGMAKWAMFNTIWCDTMLE